MMTANKDGQWNPELFKAREVRRGGQYKVDDIMASRADMQMPPIHPGCDQWSTDALALQCKMDEVIPKSSF